MNIKKKLNIMFDLHGVIGLYPNIFKPFMKTLRKCGHTVIICSGPLLEKIEDELEELNYIQDHHYDKVISVTQYLIDSGVDMVYDLNGDPWTDDETWWKSKGKIAEENNIDLMIDDSEKYSENILGKTIFLLMK